MVAGTQRIWAIGQNASMFSVVNRAFVADLYRQTGRPILYKVARLTGEESAEEILQETFARFVASGLAFESEQSAFRWLYTCSHRLAIDHLRSAPVRTAVKPSQDTLDLFSANAINGIERTTAESRVLWQQLSKVLEPREIEVALYLYCEGLSQEEVAGLLGLSRKTVVRVVAALREKVEGLKGGES